jgi:hypothetical protein
VNQWLQLDLVRGNSGKKIQGRKMVDWHSQTSDDLFALDFFAIRFVPSRQRTERLNPPEADSNSCVPCKSVSSVPSVVLL